MQVLSGCWGVSAVLHRQLRKQKKEQEQREFEALQEQGLNPYEVYRVWDAEAAAARAAVQQAAQQTQRQAEIAAALEAEEQAHRKRLAKQEFDKQVCDLQARHDPYVQEQPLLWNATN
jgi:hypothetical protein